MYNWGSKITQSPALLETAGAAFDSCKCGLHPRQGKKPWCKTCVDEYNHAYYARNRERLQSQQREYEASHRDAALARTKKWREENPDRRKAQDIRYRAKNAVKELERSRRRRAANIESERARARDYYRRNLDKFKPLYHKRRALKLGNGGAYTAQEWRDLCAQYSYACLCCGKCEPEIKLTPDHVTPLSKGGRNDIANIQPLCRACNISKNARVIDYRGSHDSAKN